MYNKTILVTGGTGSWGYELIKQLLRETPREIRIFSRNEMVQVEMQQQFANYNNLKFIIGDIRDREAVVSACKGVHYVFHLAALKHVPVCEYQPYEAIKTNITGTQNVIEASIEREVEKVIYVSTDKAADPSNTYGMTKAIGEKLIINASLRTKKTKFICVRGGNVLGSSGSVVPIFMKQIQEHSRVGITHFDMARFFLTIEDAVGLLFKATYEGKGGEIFVMKMPAFKIKDLAEVLIEYYGKINVEIKEVGIRPGEKINEILLSEVESRTSICFDEDYYVGLPPFHVEGLQEYYTSYSPITITNYSSHQELLTKKEVKQFLKKGGFLS
ncbi:polysaccharide biosynthesis protein [Bacillus thuringiensis]|uniref:polysaccharide biosynthesis protein n=1 Tax=Bacillus thuringiensis TaxID=1428 RepID=UPI0026E441FD|nr:polysaccharide biosynthesis protein [Bacillus thuringiensis]MDO6632237.1 polysaccharide biosynthesis protein [Bacillus thuringiensis]MDO6661740.1 polysaccharide biosynthesis protein [Bacillus thuringiensis]MDO6702486.1 polysaccharide biosynthesis protein [Bacillus thuringiensis]